MKLLSHSFQTKKIRIKKYWFLTKLWIFENGIVLGGPKTDPLKYFGLWRHLGANEKNGGFCRSDIPIEIDFNQKVLIPVKYLLDLFLCKIGRWIQKNETNYVFPYDVIN